MARARSTGHGTLRRKVTTRIRGTPTSSDSSRPITSTPARMTSTWPAWARRLGVVGRALGGVFGLGRAEAHRLRPTISHVRTGRRATRSSTSSDSAAVPHTLDFVTA